MTPRTSSKRFLPIQIVWSPVAAARLREIRAYVALDNPRAAERLATRIVTLVETHRLHPALGRPSGQPNLRQLVIGGTPYVIFYRLRRKQILITTVHHSAQKR
ncbi:MAG: type II toxin-antitoxin system RelE/ParE family toxin [Candidatus Acidiferrum sp.]